MHARASLTIRGSMTESLSLSTTKPWTRDGPLWVQLHLNRNGSRDSSVSDSTCENRYSRSVLDRTCTGALEMALPCSQGLRSWPMQILPSLVEGRSSSEWFGLPPVVLPRAGTAEHHPCRMRPTLQPESPECPISRRVSFVSLLCSLSADRLWMHNCGRCDRSCQVDANWYWVTEGASC
jgi:hypothetical protein